MTERITLMAEEAAPAGAAPGAGLAAVLGGPWGTAAYAGLIGLDYLLSRRRAPAPEREIRASGVYRPRVVLGRARITGHLIHVYADGRDLHLAFVLGNGPMEALDGVWIGGRRLAMHRTTTADGVRLESDDRRLRESYSGGAVTVWAYLAADGAGGASLRSVVGSGWSAAHRADGLSWVHVRLRQPADGGLFDGIPEIEFLVRGARFSWEGQVPPVWTENAAAIRRYVRREFLGEGPADIDTPSLVSALATCGAILEEPAEFDQRYMVGREAGTLHTIYEPGSPDDSRLPRGALLKVRIGDDEGDYLELEAGAFPDFPHWLRNHLIELRVSRTFPGDPALGVPERLETRAFDSDDITSEQRQDHLDRAYARWTLSAADRDWLKAARAGDRVRIELRPRGLRYSAAAVVDYDVDVADLEADLDFAWQGHVARHGAVTYYLPGARAAVAAGHRRGRHPGRGRIQRHAGPAGPDQPRRRRPAHRGAAGLGGTRRPGRGRRGRRRRRRPPRQAPAGRPDGGRCRGLRPAHGDPPAPAPPVPGGWLPHPPGRGPGPARAAPRAGPSPSPIRTAASPASASSSPGPASSRISPSPSSPGRTRTGCSPMPRRRRSPSSRALRSRRRCPRPPA